MDVKTLIKLLQDQPPSRAVYLSNLLNCPYESLPIRQVITTHIGPIYIKADREVAPRESEK